MASPRSVEILGCTGRRGGISAGAAAQGKANVPPTRRTFANLGSGRNHLAAYATVVRAAVRVNKYFRVTFQSTRMIWVTVMALTSNAGAAAGDVLEGVLPLSA